MKLPDAVVVNNYLIEATFYSTTELQDSGLECTRGNEPVPTAAQVHFIAAFRMFDEPHLPGSVPKPVSSVLETFTSLQYRFLFKSWPCAVRAVLISMLQIVPVAHPNYLGHFVSVR